MPGFDRTGPMGQGPMTGGGRSFCAMPCRAHGPSGDGVRAPRPFESPIFGVGRGGLPWGGSRGRAFGGGRGFRRW